MEKLIDNVLNKMQNGVFKSVSIKHTKCNCTKI